MNSGPAVVGGEQNQSRSMFAFGAGGKRELVMIGAAGGGVYAKQPSSYQKPRWDVTIKMDSGGQRVVQQRYEPYVREGDRVRVLGTQVELFDP
jgi:outer membrane lipoprotein SlyB